MSVVFVLGPLTYKHQFTTKTKPFFIYKKHIYVLPIHSISMVLQLTIMITFMVMEPLVGWPLLHGTIFIFPLFNFKQCYRQLQSVCHFLVLSFPVQLLSVTQCSNVKSWF